MLEKIERLINEINKVHLAFSKDYFETGKVPKVNLKHTFAKVPTEHILSYRLNLHESINDYLYRADLYDVPYFYRVKTSESILDKIERFKQRSEGYPVNSILNDIYAIKRNMWVFTSISKMLAIFIIHGSCRFGIEKMRRVIFKAIENINGIL